MYNIAVAGLLFALTLGLAPTVGHSQSGHPSVSLITEVYPPFNYLENDRTTGSSVEILSQMLERMGSEQNAQDIKVWPWARGYKMVRRHRNTVLFSTTRSAKRENLFKWVGPIANTRIVLFARKGSGVTANKLSDINRYRVGVVLQDIGNQLMLSHGVQPTSLKRVAGTDALPSLIKSLNSGHIDAVAIDENVMIWTLKRMGLHPENYYVLLPIEKADLYYAFNRGTSDQIVQCFQQALDAVKADGGYRQILKKI